MGAVVKDPVIRVRTVSRDDELIQRGANPRTGVVSPWVPCDAISEGLTDYVSLDTVTRPRPPPGHRSSSGRWRQDGSSWTFVDDGSPDLYAPHDIDSPSHHVPREVYEADLKDQIPGDEVSELRKSRIQIEKLHKSIAPACPAYRAVERSPEAKDFPGVSQRSPEPLSPSSRRIQQSSQGGISPQTPSNVRVVMKGQREACPRELVIPHKIRQPSMDAQGLRKGDTHLQSRTATSFSTPSPTVPSQYIRGGSEGRIGMRYKDRDLHSITLRNYDQSDTVMPHAAVHHLPLSLRSPAEKRQAIIAAGHHPINLTTPSRDARPKILRREGTAIAAQVQQHRKLEKSRGTPFVIGVNQQARVIADLSGTPRRPCPNGLQCPEEAPASSINTIIKHADKNLYHAGSRGQGSTPIDNPSNHSPVNQTLLGSNTAGSQHDSLAAQCSDMGHLDRKIRAVREVPHLKSVLQDVRQNQAQAEARSIPSDQHRRRKADKQPGSPGNDPLEAGSSNSNFIDAEEIQPETNPQIKAARRCQKPKSGQIEPSPNKEGMHADSRDVNSISQTGCWGRLANGISHMANDDGEQRIPVAKNCHTNDAFTRSKEQPPRSEILRESEGGVFFAGQWIDASSDTAQTSSHSTNPWDFSNSIRSRPKRWSTPVEWSCAFTDAAQTSPKLSLIQQVTWGVVRHVSKSFQMTMPALQTLRSSNAGAINYLSALWDIGIAGIYLLLLLNLLLLLRNALLATAVLVHWIWNPFSTLVAIIRWCVI